MAASDEEVEIASNLDPWEASRQRERDNYFNGKCAKFRGPASNEHSADASTPSAPKDLRKVFAIEPESAKGTQVANGKSSAQGSHKQQLLDALNGGTNGQLKGVGQKGSVHTSLAPILDRMSGIEKQIQLETRQRRASEENRFSVIREATCKLESTLNSEIKRRVEANKTLQAMFESQIASVQDKLERVLMDKIDQLQAAVDDLTQRVVLSEREVKASSHVHQLEERFESIASEIAALQEAMEHDRTVHQEKENAIIKGIGLLEHQLDAKLEGERVSRAKSISALNSSFDEYKQSRCQSDEQFQSFVIDEVATVKKSIVNESETREQADDDIVQALNHYTKALQDALRIVNSV